MVGGDAVRSLDEGVAAHGMRAPRWYAVRGRAPASIVAPALRPCRVEESICVTAWLQGTCRRIHRWPSYPRRQHHLPTRLRTPS